MRRKNIDEWLRFANDNYLAAIQLSESGLLSPCLQNCQQAIEKYLKALLLYENKPIQKTHNIEEILNLLGDKRKELLISDDEADLVNSIYLPSKYPGQGVMRDFEPNTETCLRCIEIIEKVRDDVLKSCEIAK
jgi:HEPN domain-containing protein